MVAEIFWTHQADESQMTYLANHEQKQTKINNLLD